MAKIFKLDQHTANLIAAGEVIERAASVVKELVENSIDAGATKINIILTDSGLTEIIVQDNGSGMDSVDAKMCVEPHATSKIKTGEDLFRILTLGFRGEALPSIVSVSNFRIKTSADGVKGFMYSLKGRDIINEAIIAYPKGTEISVRNLFFNTPARLQSLQSPSVELSHIVDYINRIALSRPDIAFKLTNNDRIILQTYGSNRLQEVIFNIYGDEVARNMIDIFDKNAYFEISGYVSKPSVSKSNKNQINILVNNRVIRNSKIINAVCDAYKERLVTGRYPITVINIEVDPTIVDVNIHPAKLEVRFANEMELITMISNAIDYSLSQTDLIVDVRTSKEKNPDVNEENSESEVLINNSITEQYFDQIESEETIPTKEATKTDTYFSNDKLFSFKSIKEEDFKIEKAQETIFDEIVLEEEEIEETEQFHQESYELHTEHIKDTRVNKLPKMYYVGQLHGTYLLFQDAENFYIVDQHAAYERINYERISAELKKETTIHYELLIPIKLNFPISEAVLVREKIEDLAKVGIIIEDFGSGTFTVREVPIWFTKGKEQEFVEEVIFSFINNKKIDKFSFFDELAKSLACKRSIKANQHLEKIHIEYLMEDLGKCDKPYSCPHGRPTIVKFATTEIERWFKRIV